MAYETGSATGAVDLLTKLDTFMVANGWSQDEFSTGSGKGAWHKNNVYVSLRWNVSGPANIGIFHALGWTSGQWPGNHPQDSGQGVISDVNGTIDNGRYVSLGSDSIPSYWFFEDDTYIHVVCEIDTDVYRHFGWGIINKFGDDWTGGEYCYGHRKTSTADPVFVQDSALLDGRTTSTTYRLWCASLHIEDMPGQAGTDIWGVVWGDYSSSQGTDRASNDRVFIQGGFRGGPMARSLGHFAAGNQSGLIPMYPICLFHRASTNVYYLGNMPDVKGITIENYEGGDEVTIGSEVWVVFPTSRKGSDTEGTKDQGIAYLKVTS